MVTTSSKSHFIFILLTGLIMICAVQGNTHEITVDAARSVTSNKGTGISHIVYLYSGTQILILKDNKLIFAMPRGTQQISDATHLRSAFTRKEPDEFDYYGDDSSFYVDFKTNLGAQAKKYDSSNEFFSNGGPDAVARRGFGVCFFKGCKMAFRDADGTWGESIDVKSRGLPCNIDAAWKEYQSVVLLKGDQIWRWKENDTVDGPRNFKDSYDLNDWTLKPSAK